ncbi:hypothetical protein PGB90_008202 [Kerria lacca]
MYDTKIAMVLEAYSNVFSFIASTATIPLLLSPSLICKNFIKKGFSDDVRPLIFVGGLSRCILFLQFGIQSGLRSLIRVHSFGTLLYATYLTLYYIYCKNRVPLHKMLIKAIIFVLILLGFVNFKTDSLITVHFGFIVTIVHLSILASPLMNVKNVIKTKSTAGMPFPLIICGTVVSVSWLLYGISIHNYTLILQMTISVILTGTQLSLFVIYPSKLPKPVSKDE